MRSFTPTIRLAALTARAPLTTRSVSACLATFALFAQLDATAQTPNIGFTYLGTPDKPITVFYPSQSAAQSVKRGNNLAFDGAFNGVPDDTSLAAKQRLIVLSHGSGGSAWTYTGLIAALTREGYVVAVPEHAGDNYRDHSKIGPPSWKLRPLEVSATIDAVAREPRFAGRFDERRVGMWGMSAGGHTALTLAGGRWSPARMLAHCEVNLAADFAACTGAATDLTGGALDGPKQWVARQMIRRHLQDDTGEYGHTDARIQAIVSGVPWAANFDPTSLRTPTVALGLIQAQQDRWLLPRLHSAAVLAACQTCTSVADLPTGGHGALLDPLPSGMPSQIQNLLDDPAGFDRAAVLPDLYRRTLAFFNDKLR